MPFTPESWKKVAKKKFLNSSEFNNLNSAAKAWFKQGNNPATMNNLSACWDAWEAKLQKKNKNYKTSDRYVNGGALDGLAELLGKKVAAAPIRTHARPNSHAAQIQARDALNPHIRASGGNYVKQGNAWVPVIFPQEERFSCTCACATTFLNKMIDTPIAEAAFKAEYNKTTGAQHDFDQSGSLWQPITNTLLKFGADVTFNSTSNWQALRGFLDKATPESPVLFGIQWDNGGSPGGGHALICVGTGVIPGWSSNEVGYIIEDPWPQHELPGMTDDGTNGHYEVKNIGPSGTWNEGYAQPVWGCITGKKSRREFGKNLSHTQGGIKMPGM